MLDLTTIQEKNWTRACKTFRAREGYVPQWVHSVMETTGWRTAARSVYERHLTPFEQQSFTGAELEAYRAKQHARPCFD